MAKTTFSTSASANAPASPETLRVPLADFDSASEIQDVDPVPASGARRLVYEARRAVEFVRTHDARAVLHKARGLVADAALRVRDAVARQRPGAKA